MKAREPGGVDFTAPSPPLLEAVKAGSIVKVRSLLVSKVDLEARDSFGWTALHWAASKGPDLAEALLEAGAKVDNPALDDNETPLHFAAQEGHESIVRVLVANRADVGAKNNDGETPLHVGIQHVGNKKHLGFLTALVELGADPWDKDHLKHDAFANAAILTNRGPEIKDTLLKAAPNDSDPASLYAHLDAAQFTNAVKIACHRGQNDSVEKLLKFRPDQAASVAQSCLVRAVSSGHIPVVTTLIEARADISNEAQCNVNIGGADDADHVATTPLIAAAGDGTTSMVRFLLNANADANHASPDGATPLMSGAIRGSAEIVQLLLSEGAEVNAKASKGWTALMAASQNGKTETVRTLLDARADLEFRSDDGHTARDLAHNNNHHDVADCLKKRALLLSRQKQRAITQPGGPAQEDTRDLDSLLEDLGEVPEAKTKAKKLKLAKATTKSLGKASSQSRGSIVAPAIIITQAPLEIGAPSSPEYEPQETLEKSLSPAGLRKSTASRANKSSSRNAVSKTPAVPVAPSSCVSENVEDRPDSAKVKNPTSAGLEVKTEAKTKDPKENRNKESKDTQDARNSAKDAAKDARKAEVARLLARLSEIDAERAKLDSEELNVRRQLGKLEHGF